MNADPWAALTRLMRQARDERWSDNQVRLAVEDFEMGDGWSACRERCTRCHLLWEAHSWSSHEEFVRGTRNCPPCTFAVGCPQRVHRVTCPGWITRDESGRPMQADEVQARRELFAAYWGATS